VSGPRGSNGMGALPGWAELEAAVPQVAATMRRYLTQISCVLRPGSVGGADLALRWRASPGARRLLSWLWPMGPGRVTGAMLVIVSVVWGRELRFLLTDAGWPPHRR
jgi:hypothetical protein